MSTIWVVLAVNLIFAVVAISESGRRPSSGIRRPKAPQRAEMGFDARVRVAEFGAMTLRPQSLVTVRVAPLDEPGTAIEVRPGANGPLRRIGVHEILDARLWLRGRPVAIRGEASEGHSNLRPLSAELADWELEVTTRGGEAVRCYGASLTPAVEQDLLLLRRMLAVRDRAASSGHSAARRDARPVRLPDLGRRPAALGGL